MTYTPTHTGNPALKPHYGFEIRRFLTALTLDFHPTLTRFLENMTEARIQCLKCKGVEKTALRQFRVFPQLFVNAAVISLIN